MGWDGLPAHDSGDPGPITGVLLRVRMAYGDDVDTLVPDRPGDAVIDLGRPFMDPYRKIQIDLLSRDDDHAVIRLSGQADLRRADLSALAPRVPSLATLFPFGTGNPLTPVAVTRRDRRPVAVDLGAVAVVPYCLTARTRAGSAGSSR